MLNGIMELMIVFMLIINATVAVGLLSELWTNLATLLSRDLGGASALGGVLMSGRGRGRRGRQGASTWKKWMIQRCKIIYEKRE